MKKNFQLFMFFLFTLLAAFLAYMGNDILVRMNELEEKVTKFQDDVDTFKGALAVVKAFEGIMDKDPKGDILNNEGKAVKAENLKPAEAFYCAQSLGEDTLIVELDKKYRFKTWSVPNTDLKTFSRIKEPNALGSYFIRGSIIYVTGLIDGIRQNRKSMALKADSNGYISQFETGSIFFSTDICPRDVQVAY